MKPPAGGITAREPMVMTRPRPAAVISGTAARAAVNVAVRLSASIWSHVARSVSRRPPPAKPPTSVTRTSSRGWRGLGAEWLRTSLRLIMFFGASFSGRDGHDGRALDVLVAHLADVEVGQVLAQLPERLLEGRQRLALPCERRGAREDEVLHVGMVDPALLDPGHDPNEHL